MVLVSVDTVGESLQLLVNHAQTSRLPQSKDDIPCTISNTLTDSTTLLTAKEKGYGSSIVSLSKEKENYGLINERERRKTQCQLPKPEPNAE
jgi:hypothetical protein